MRKPLERTLPHVLIKFASMCHNIFAFKENSKLDFLYNRITFVNIYYIFFLISCIYKIIVTSFLIVYYAILYCSIDVFIKSKCLLEHDFV